MFHKIKGILKNYFVKSTIRKQLKNINIQDSAVVYPSSKIVNIHDDKNLIKIGANSHIRGHLELLGQGGKIEIGDFCYVGEQTRIWSAEHIKIGNRVLIAHNVNIHDNNSHPNDAELRHRDFKRIIGLEKTDANFFKFNTKPIIIEDDCWIGFNSTIWKGVTIGKGSIVAACSLVIADIPPNVIVSGNPARIIKKVK